MTIPKEFIKNHEISIDVMSNIDWTRVIRFLKLKEKVRTTLLNNGKENIIYICNFGFTCTDDEYLQTDSSMFREREHLLDLLVENYHESWENE